MRLFIIIKQLYSVVEPYYNMLKSAENRKVYITKLHKPIKKK